MSSIPVPDGPVIAGIGAVIAGAFSWLLRLERRPRGITRKEHDEICQRRQAEVKEDLSEIKNILKEQDRQSREYRNTTTTDITAIRIALAKRR